MKERSVGENLRIISDVPEYTKNEELKGVLFHLTSGKHLTLWNGHLQKAYSVKSF